MKRKKYCGLILAVSVLMLTGCSQEAMYEMTEEEQQLVVNYSAHVISKFNTYQKDGLTYISQGCETEIVIEEPEILEETETIENTEIIKEEISSGQTAEGASGEGVSTALGEVYKDTGLIISYVNCEITNTYVESDVYALKPSPGKTFVILNLTAENAKDEAITLDNMSDGSSFSLKGVLNSETQYNAPAVLSLLTNDFATYEETIKPQTSVELILVFEVPEETTSIDNLVLKINKNGSIFEINL